MKKADIYLNDKEEYSEAKIKSTVVNQLCQEAGTSEAEGDTKGKILKLWKDVLSNDKIGVDDSFFKLGGNSILLMQFHARLDKYFPGVVTIPDLFAYSTVGKLSDFIDSKSPGQPPALSLKNINLPAEYLQSGFDNCGFLHFNFQIRGDLFNRLSIIAEKENASLKDILITVFLYLFSNIGVVREIEMLAALDNPDYITKLNADFTNSDDFSQVIGQVRAQVEKSWQHPSYMLSDIERMEVYRGKDSVIPLILLKELNINKTKLLDSFDIIFEIEIETNRICLMFSFNADRLDEVRMEELTEKYIQLIEHIVNQ
ncbi:Phosphopantetheine attachment site [Alkaliphilus peptidifermentans DSM 18978]|uniref:Phosphopantetheine attachment site n=2 Tax=Alkaliphilus TaxID=114627 RepID=A0A1G5K821_9FIRM|nr:Phosphopantetheine attachment site [Alkaliphilus peptidifermentans DSM 18978]